MANGLNRAGWMAGRVLLLSMVFLISTGQRGGEKGTGPGCGPRETKPDPSPVTAGAPAPAAASSWHPAGGQTLAVADLSAQSGSASDASVISSLLRGELVRTGRFKLVEKTQMDKVLSEQAFQQTGCTSQECAVKLGKMLNVQLMVVGEFGKLMGQSFASVRVVNVESGEVVYADKAKGNTADEVEAAVAAMAGRIAGTGGAAAPSGGSAAPARVGGGGR